mgnify:CR=1 FL=1|tara:strand:- start:863 stop:976 length:114 start_codon:yes stop_codon:yes gene_type:complete
MRENGKWSKTGKQYDGMTLNDASAKIKDAGGKKIKSF